VKIAIDSFFIDYYDHWFDRRDEADEVWKRHGNLPPYRREALQMMRDKGINTVPFGYASDLRVHYGPDTKVVYYYDETGHATDGKILTLLRWIPYDDSFCSIYVDSGFSPPLSYRVLHIGEKVVVWSMVSDHNWLSNGGTDINIKLVGDKSVTARMLPLQRSFNYPLYAIDFVPNAMGHNFAVDFNICPGLSKTPVEDIITPRECAEAIMSYAQKYDFNGRERAS
jgi:hypothetical protein